MNLYRFFVLLLSLGGVCEAGPIVVGANAAARAAGAGKAASAIAASRLAGSVGVAASGIWYGGYVIVDGALFWSSGVAAGGALAGVAAAAAGM